MNKRVSWRTADGREVPVGDMTDSHLLNAIRWARRTHRGRCWAMAWSADTYAMTAPDMASDAASHAAEEGYDLAKDRCDYAVAVAMHECHPLAAVLREARRRKLAFEPSAECTYPSEYIYHETQP